MSFTNMPFYDCGKKRHSLSLFEEFNLWESKLLLERQTFPYSSVEITWDGLIAWVLRTVQRQYQNPNHRFV